LTNDELSKIADRATAPTSMGYGFTHYRQDVLALMKALLEERNGFEKLAERVKKLERLMDSIHPGWD